MLGDLAWKVPPNASKPYQPTIARKTSPAALLKMTRYGRTGRGVRRTSVVMLMCSDRRTSSTEPTKTIQTMPHTASSSDHWSELLST